MTRLFLRSSYIAAIFVLGFFQQALGQLPSAPPATVRISAERLARIDAAVQTSIEKKELPGAVVLVARHGKIVWRKAYGARAVEPQREAMTLDTIFDLASLTKVVATTTSVMMLLEQGKVRLNDPVIQFIPEMKGDGRDAITIEQLMTHMSGFAPDFDLRDRWTGYDEAIKRLERSPSWVWTAMDPQSKLLVVVEVGSRTLALAQRVGHQVTEVVAPGCVPLFLTDGLKDDATALLPHFGQWRHPARRQERGPLPKPRWLPLPALRYAQVVKSYRRRRLVGVTHRVVFGTRLAIEQGVARCGWTINTAFVERLNLDSRQRVAAIGRRVNTLCQGEAGLRDQWVLFQVYHNFVLPHASLRQALDEPMPTPRMGSARVWRPCTPAMAAGVTDHVWSLKEVLLYRVPPWPQPQTV